MEGRPVRVLVVEDEARMAGVLRRGLEEDGFAVDVAASGEDGLWYARENDYDAIVLDLILPGVDGFAVLEDLRASGRWAPVLFLTARDAVQDRVRGLDLGADDYLVKPFAFSELLARVRSILRRGPARQPELLRVADLKVDLTRHQTSREGRRLELTPKEFVLLA